MVLVPITTNADDRADSIKSSYQSAIEALNNNDCKTAVHFLEKYKIEAAAQLKERPDFLGLIDLQIEECRRKPDRVTVRLIAGGDTAAPAGAPGAAAGGLGVGVSGVLGIVILVVIILVLL